MRTLKDIAIERVITDSDGHITALDIHDQQFGDAIYLKKVSEHFHGFYSPKPKKVQKKSKNRK